MASRPGYTAGPSRLRQTWSPPWVESNSPTRTQYEPELTTNSSSESRPRNQAQGSQIAIGRPMCLTLRTDAEGTARIEFRMPVPQLDCPGSNSNVNACAIFQPPTGSGEEASTLARRNTVEKNSSASVPASHSQYLTSTSESPQHPQSHATSPSKPPVTGRNPYASLVNPYPPDGTQFFILDSSGKDPSGLATYTVLPPCPNSSTIDPFTGERMNYLTPAATIFRAAESRLMPMGYRNGDTVKQKHNSVSARVLRRYVLGNERRYDLRDGLGQVWREVTEVELENGLEELRTTLGGYGEGGGKTSFTRGNEVHVDAGSLDGLDLEDTHAWDDGAMDAKTVDWGGGWYDEGAFLGTLRNDDGFQHVEMLLD